MRLRISEGSRKFSGGGDIFIQLTTGLWNFLVAATKGRDFGISSGNLMFHTSIGKYIKIQEVKCLVPDLKIFRHF
jgi:hypothetical protein